MKVVLFCGGMGMRLREYSEEIPKPMIKIGYRPILWHLMKYYAHFGHNDFILCLGYKADVIKEYFLHYEECLSNDFVMSGDRNNVSLLNRDIRDWRITFVDTGMSRNIGGRLLAVKELLCGEDIFLANYSDNLTDLNLPEMIEDFSVSDDAVASFLCVRPSQSFHVVSLQDDRQVRCIQEVASSDMWINGGFFVFRQEFFDYLEPGDELVDQPFQRLIREKRLNAYRYDKFWQAMDTFKEKQRFDEMYARGDAPWEVWSRGQH